MALILGLIVVRLATGKVSGTVFLGPGTVVGPNTYEDSRCQETHSSSKRFFALFSAFQGLGVISPRCRVLT